MGRCVTKADRSPVCCLWGRKSGRPILKSKKGRRPQAGASLPHRSMLALGVCVQPRACRQLYFCSTAWSRLKLARGLPQLHGLACHFKGLCRMQRKAALQIQVAACDSKLNLGLDTALSLHRICCFSRPSLYSTVQRSRLRLDRVRRWRPKSLLRRTLPTAHRLGDLPHFVPRSGLISAGAEHPTTSWQEGLLVKV